MMSTDVRHNPRLVRPIYILRSHLDEFRAYFFLAAVFFFLVVVFCWIIKTIVESESAKREDRMKKKASMDAIAAS